MNGKEAQDSTPTIHNDGIPRRTALTLGVSLMGLSAMGQTATGEMNQEIPVAVSPRKSSPLLVLFQGGDDGQWRIDSIKSVVGESLPLAPKLKVIEGAGSPTTRDGRWLLRGSTSNVRYTDGNELATLKKLSDPLNRPAATRAALIPIRKNDAWWALAQDERRAIFEEQSHHIAIGIEYLPPIARRLHHGRELGEPFDFLTWFEYGPEHTDAFETLVRRLRATKEWSYVDREVDIRLSRS